MHRYLYSLNEFQGPWRNRILLTCVLIERSHLMWHPYRWDPFDCEYLDDKTSFAWISFLNQEIYSRGGEEAPIKSPSACKPLYARYHPPVFYALSFLHSSNCTYATDNIWWHIHTRACLCINKEFLFIKK